jgi:hypothetical protein
MSPPSATQRSVFCPDPGQAGHAPGQPAPAARKQLERDCAAPVQQDARVHRHAEIQAVLLMLPILPDPSAMQPLHRKSRPWIFTHREHEPLQDVAVLRHYCSTPGAGGQHRAGEAAGAQRERLQRGRQPRVLLRHARIGPRQAQRLLRTAQSPFAITSSPPFSVKTSPSPFLGRI